MSIISFNAYTNTSAAVKLKPALGMQNKSAADDVSVTANSAAGATAEPNVNDLQTAVDNLNKHIAPLMQTITFSMAKDSGKMVVKVLDADTQKVVRQIPSEDAIAMSKTLDRLQGLQGLMVKDTA